MSDSFDVFDEWGNFVGKFIPAAGGGGCLFAIAILITAAICFVVYLYVKLIVEGFKAAMRKEWLKAFGYWLIPGVSTLSITMLFIGAITVEAAKQIQREEEERAKLIEYEWAIGHRNEILTFERLEGGLGWIEGCNQLCDGITFGRYKITNHLKHHWLHLESETCQPFWANGIPTIQPQQTIVVYCFERRQKSRSWTPSAVDLANGGKVRPCITIWFRYVPGYREWELKRPIVCAPILP